jgi:hypothetical protein
MGPEVMRTDCRTVFVPLGNEVTDGMSERFPWIYNDARNEQVILRNSIKIPHDDAESA